MKKPCAGCGKQIPDAALHCVFCGAKQGEVSEVTEQIVRPSAPAEGAAEAEPPQRTTGSRSAVTLMGLRVEDIEASIKASDAAASRAADSMPTPQIGTPMVSSAPVHIPLDPTPVRGLPVVIEEPGKERKEPPRPIRRRTPRATPFSATVRLVMASGGLVLVALFSLPWRGVTSWQLLDTLAGADFVRQLFFLAGGAILLTTALLPVPALFRALVGTFVAAVPLVLGAEGMLDGWRGLCAAIVLVGLPASLLQLRPRQGRGDRMARALLVVAVSMIGILYFVPISSIVPLVYVARMLGSGLVVPTVVGLFLGIPLVLGVLSLLGALGRDLTSAAVLLSVLVLLWSPAAVLLFGTDGTQLYVALALLWTSATAALCAAQLLALAARRRP